MSATELGITDFIAAVKSKSYSDAMGTNPQVVLLVKAKCCNELIVVTEASGEKTLGLTNSNLTLGLKGMHCKKSKAEEHSFCVNCDIDFGNDAPCEFCGGSEKKKVILKDVVYEWDVKDCPFLVLYSILRIPGSLGRTASIDTLALPSEENLFLTEKIKIEEVTGKVVLPKPVQTTTIDSLEPPQSAKTKTYNEKENNPYMLYYDKETLHPSEQKLYSINTSKEYATKSFSKWVSINQKNIKGI